MTEADYVLIDKKLDGSLSAEEIRAFDQRYKQDPVFAEEYELHQQLIDTFRAQHPQRLKAEMKVLHQEAKAERRARLRRGAYRWAATIALLLVATAAFFYLRIPPPLLLYAEYYQPYRAKIIPRGAWSEQGSEVERLYSEKRFATATLLLRELSEEDTTRADYWKLLLGNAYLQSDSISQAIRQFQQVGTTRNEEYREYARWYLAMGYLKKQDVATAQEILQSIANQPGLFHRKAQQLLDEL